MGKRKLQGAKLRAKKRMKEQLDELQEQQAEEYTTQRWIDEHNTTTTTTTETSTVTNPTKSKKNSNQKGGSTTNTAISDNHDDVADIDMTDNEKSATTLISTNNLFVLDTVGEGTTKSKPKKTNKKDIFSKVGKQLTTDTEKTTTGTVQNHKVQQMIQNHTPKQIQQLVKDGRKRLQQTKDGTKTFAQLLRPNRQIDYSTTPSNSIKNTNNKTKKKNTTKFDLWDDNTTRTSTTTMMTTTTTTTTKSKNSNNAVTTETTQIVTVTQVPEPGIGGALAGTRPGHCVVTAKTLAASTAAAKAKKDAAMVGKNDKNKADTTTAAATAAASKKKKKKSKKKKKNTGNEPTTTNSEQQQQVAGTTRKAVAVDVAKSGQSYHPDPVAYQTLLNQAVKVEMLRDAATKELSQPVAKGMSDETRALLVDDSSDEDDDDDEGDDNAGTSSSMAVGKLPKRADKLTKAQRNKQKRIKKQMIAMKQYKEEKKMLKQVNNVNLINKELRKKELQSKQKRTEQSKNNNNKPIPGQDIEMKAFQRDPISAPTIPIALLASGSGTSTTKTKQAAVPSLRTLRPRGSLLTDRVQSYTDRNLIPRSMKMKHFMTVAGRTSVHDIEKKQSLLQQINTTTTITVLNRTNNNTTTTSTNEQQIAAGNHTIKNINNKKFKKKKKVVGLHNWNGPDYKILGC